MFIYHNRKYVLQLNAVYFWKNNIAVRLIFNWTAPNDQLDPTTKPIVHSWRTVRHGNYNSDTPDKSNICVYTPNKQESIHQNIFVWLHWHIQQGLPPVVPKIYAKHFYKSTLLETSPLQHKYEEWKLKEYR